MESLDLTNDSYRKKSAIVYMEIYTWGFLAGLTNVAEITYMLKWQPEKWEKQSYCKFGSGQTIFL